LFHAGLEETFNLQLGRGFTPDDDAYRKAQVTRLALRQALISTMAEQRIRAFIYPVLRRKPARIGEIQRGSTARVSAQSGLPALTVPAGFTDDGLPIGIEMLAGPFDESGLLSLGYAIEQATRVRQRPFSTPSLQAGVAPEPRGGLVVLASAAGPSGVNADLIVDLRLAYDVTTSCLRYHAHVKPAGDEVRSVWLHRGVPAQPGPALQPLQMAGQGSSCGEINLSFVERRALQAGELFLTLYTAQRPTGAARAPVLLGP
jgi:amidase